MFVKWLILLSAASLFNQVHSAYVPLNLRHYQCMLVSRVDVGQIIYHHPVRQLAQ